MRKKGDRRGEGSIIFARDAGITKFQERSDNKNTSKMKRGEEKIAQKWGGNMRGVRARTKPPNTHSSNTKKGKKKQGAQKDGGRRVSGSTKKKITSQGDKFGKPIAGKNGV